MTCSRTIEWSSWELISIMTTVIDGTIYQVNGTMTGSVSPVGLRNQFMGYVLFLHGLSLVSFGWEYWRESPGDPVSSYKLAHVCTTFGERNQKLVTLTRRNTHRGGYWVGGKEGSQNIFIKGISKKLRNFIIAQLKQSLPYSKKGVCKGRKTTTKRQLL